VGIGFGWAFRRQVPITNAHIFDEKLSTIFCKYLSFARMKRLNKPQNETNFCFAAVFYFSSVSVNPCMLPTYIHHVHYVHVDQ